MSDTPTTLIDMVREMKALEERGLHFGGRHWEWNGRFCDFAEVLTILRGLAAEVGARKGLFVLNFPGRAGVFRALGSHTMQEVHTVGWSPHPEPNPSTLAEAACCLWIIMQEESK